MDKLRLGVIGTGSVVREIYQHLYFHSAYSPILSVEAAADPNEAALAAFCDQYDIPTSRRFTSYEAMIGQVDLDTVHVNTPDGLHEAPTVFALDRGLDVVVPKPLARSVSQAHHMIEAARRNGRFLGVDYHKRNDPCIKGCRAQYRAGKYGRLQSAVWYMLDRLMVVNPNHEPRFFSSVDFGAQNSPISFLTVHMADALMHITGGVPATVCSHAWSQKLPSLRPIPVPGFDMCDTQVLFDTGAVAHFVSGWHLPNTAHALTVQSARLVCTDGCVDLGLDTQGYHEITDEGIRERSPAFLNFEEDGHVSGFGLSRPGRLFETILQSRRGELSDDKRAALMTPQELGFHTTAVVEAAELSLARGIKTDSGAVHGIDIDVQAILADSLGEAGGEG